MKIIHSFAFFNEFELLPVKLEELWDVVDYFILVEATNTFTNRSKPLWFQERMDEFKKYDSKLLPAVVTLPDGPDKWVRERYQREIGKQFAQHVSSGSDDVLIWSDMDEIVSASGVRRWLNGETNHKVTAFKLNFYYYYLNNFAPNLDWCGGKIGRMSDLNRPLSDIRYDGNLPVIAPGGWHFSFLGGEERIKLKILSYAHDELFHYAADSNNMKSALEQGTDLFHRDIDFQFVPIDSSYPKYILDHLDDYNHMIKPLGDQP